MLGKIEGMLGKIEGRMRRGQQRIRRLDGITDLKDTSLSKFQELVTKVHIVKAMFFFFFPRTHVWM